MDFISIIQKSFYRMWSLHKTLYVPKFPLQKNRSRYTKHSISSNRRITKPLKQSSKNPLWQFQIICKNEHLLQVYQKRSYIGKAGLSYISMATYYNEMQQICNYLNSSIIAAEIRVYKVVLVSMERFPKKDIKISALYYLAVG